MHLNMSSIKGAKAIVKIRSVFTAVCNSRGGSKFVCREKKIDIRFV